MSTLVKNPPAPGTPEWYGVVTASKIPAILGISPFSTAGDTWLEMTTQKPATILDEVQEKIFAWGHHAEDALVNNWLWRNPGWQASKGEVAYTDTDLPFPNLVTLDRRARRGSRKHILECKTSVSRRIWGDPGDEIPTGVLAQVIFQMGVSGIHEATVIALVAQDFPVWPRLYEVEWNEEFYKAICQTVTDFYAHVESGEMLPIDWDAIIWAGHQQELKQPKKDDGVADIDPDLLGRLTVANQDFEAAKTNLDSVKQEAITALGKHQKLVDPAGHAVVAKAKGRFSKTNLPDDLKYLLKLPELQKQTFDSAKLKKTYPDAYASAVGDPSYRFNL